MQELEIVGVFKGGKPLSPGIVLSFTTDDAGEVKSVTAAAILWPEHKPHIFPYLPSLAEQPDAFYAWGRYEPSDYPAATEAVAATTEAAEPASAGETDSEQAGSTSPA